MQGGNTAIQWLHFNAELLNELNPLVKNPRETERELTRALLMRFYYGLSKQIARDFGASPDEINDLGRVQEYFDKFLREIKQR